VGKVNAGNNNLNLVY